MKEFTPDDVVAYYRDSEAHYKMFWDYSGAMGLHYGVWEKGTKNLSASIMNTNALLVQMGKVAASDKVLDAGCGVGGTAIWVAKNVGAHVTGITLAAHQIQRAKDFAVKNGVSEKTNFRLMNYINTDFADDSFDVVFAIESLETAQSKEGMFSEVSRVLKPGGKFLIADVFKSYDYPIDRFPVMGTMINGWAISDLLSIEQLRQKLANAGMTGFDYRNVTKEISKTVNIMFGLSILGMFGTFFYNLFNNASHFSKVHYKTGLAQYSAYKQKLWEYHLVCAAKSIQ
jgi:cyclopropane fatty-acyl-phospholipid synthase-like methyltransferase